MNESRVRVCLCVCVLVCLRLGVMKESRVYIFLCVCPISVRSPSSLKGCLGYSVQVLLRGEVSSWGLSFRCN